MLDIYNYNCIISPMNRDSSQLEKQLLHHGLEASGYYSRGWLLLGQLGLAATCYFGGKHLVESSEQDFQHARQAAIQQVTDHMKPLDPSVIEQANEYRVYKHLNDESVTVTNGVKADETNQNWDIKPPGMSPTAAAKANLNLQKHVDNDYLDKIYQSYFEYRDWQDNRNWLASQQLAEVKHNALERLLGKTMRAFGSLYPLALFAKQIIFFESEFVNIPEDFGRRRSLSRSALDLLPEHEDAVPSEKVVKAYFEKVKLLPPIGSKLVEIFEDDSWQNRILPVRQTAETMSRDVVNFIGSREGTYIHHLTVQGQLPDTYKYVAATLLLNNSYKADWDEPFYNANWGKAGPLIHDGGNTISQFNSRWKYVYGRTDFIQRVIKVHDEDDTEDETGASVLMNQSEMLRIEAEARFYQRMALALHCAIGTKIKKVPPELSEELTEIWDGFQEGSQKMLRAIGATSLIDTPWFLPKARKLKGWQTRRFEADFQPIQESLKQLDERKLAHPEIQEIAGRAIREFSNKVDEALGLNPPSVL
jgi:hypothetical protein